MSTHFESEAFRHGFVAHWSQLSEQEKQAGLGSAIAGAMPKVIGGAKSLIGRGPGSQMGLPGMGAATSAGAPGLASRIGSGVTNWVSKNPTTALGAGAGVAGATNLATGAGTASVVANKARETYTNEANNALTAGRAGFEDYLGKMGGNSFMGRLMLMLNMLFGGQDARNKFYSGLQTHLSTYDKLSPLNRGIVGQHAQPAPAGATPVAPSTPPQPAPTA